MKVSIPGWVSATYYSFYENGKVPYSYSFTATVDRPQDTEYNICLCPHVIETEVPDIDPTASIVSALQAHKADIFRKAAQDAAEVDDKIQKYLALTNEVPAQASEVDDDIPF